jgi:ABC-type transport system substrate-binding protein
LFYDYLGFNTALAPFTDARVRQAFVHAIDKELLADSVLHGYPEPALGGMIPPGLAGHQSRPVLPHNPQRARRLLAEAGFPDGHGFPYVEWLVVTPAFAEIADYLRQQWQRVLQVDIPYKPVSWETLYQRFNSSPPMLFIESRIADFPDPETFLGDGPIGQFCRYEDEIFGWLLQDARTTFDQSKRTALYEQLDRMVVEEAVLAPLVYNRVHALVKPWVHSFPFSPMTFWCWKDVVLGPRDGG